MYGFTYFEILKRANQLQIFKNINCFNKANLHYTSLLLSNLLEYVIIIKIKLLFMYEINIIFFYKSNYIKCIVFKK